MIKIKDREKNERLFQARLSREWTQAQLADKIDSSPLQINRWERGKSRPGPYFRQKLTRVFEMSEEQLGLTSKDATEQSTSSEVSQDSHLTDYASVKQTLAPLELPSYALQTPSTNGRTNEAIRGTDPVKMGRPHASWRKPKWTVPVLFSLLLIAALSGGGLTYLHANPSVMGHLTFLSSGQISPSSNVGVADGVQVDLRPLRSPAPRNSYFVWLLPDEDQPENTVFLLGKMTMSGSFGTLSYTDAQHTNLLAVTSRLLVTEQSTAPQPLAPSVDQSDWRYLAQIPNQPSHGQNYGFLDHLRHLLALDPTLTAHGLPGGLTPWLYRNTQTVYAQALMARDAQTAATASPPVIRQEVITLLYYLDGASFVASDLPSILPSFTPPDARLSSIGLLQLQAKQDPPGYLYHVALHLNGLSSSPGATPSLKTEATRLIDAINAVNACLQQVRQDAKQVAGMTNEQLRQQPASDLLNAMVITANSALVGQTDAGTTEAGVESIMTSTEHLASLGFSA